MRQRRQEIYDVERNDADLVPRTRRVGRSGALPVLGDDFTWSEPRSRRDSRPSAAVPAAANLISRAAQATADPFSLPTVLPEAPSPLWPEVSHLEAVAPAHVEAVAPAPLNDVAPAHLEAVASSRRTIVITGRGAEARLPARRSYSASLRRHERSGFQPDRVAMWAFLLGIALLLGAVTSSHAAVLPAHAALHRHLVHEDVVRGLRSVGGLGTHLVHAVGRR